MVDKIMILNLVNILLLLLLLLQKAKVKSHQSNLAIDKLKLLINKV